MRTVLILMALIFLTRWVCGQPNDSTPSTINSFVSSSNNATKIPGGYYSGIGQKHWINKEYVIIETTKLQLTSVEEEISTQESNECKALLARDTAALRHIWLRDFTLDDPQNEILISKNPIPHYLSLSRVIEKFILLDNVVYTSGYENIVLLKSDGKIDRLFNRKFTHRWAKKLLTWTLTSKSYE